MEPRASSCLYEAAPNEHCRQRERAESAKRRFRHADGADEDVARSRNETARRQRLISRAGGGQIVQIKGVGSASIPIRTGRNAARIDEEWIDVIGRIGNYVADEDCNQ